MKRREIRKYDTKSLVSLCEPLLNSHAFKRLDKISFLGILSPKYAKCDYDEFYVDQISIDEGSRYDHSIGVALIAFEIASKLNFSVETTKYAVCWGLLHDIATWPLSHTGEAAFSELFHLSSRKLREMIILGATSLPQEYRLNAELERIGVEPHKLLSLFDKVQSDDVDQELKIFKTIIHSPITPDTLEGIWRSGKVWNIRVPEIVKKGPKLKADLFGPYIPKKYSNMYIDFWEKKSLLYDKFINSEKCVSFESDWSLSIINYFKDITLIESLELDEKEIVDRVNKNGVLRAEQIKKYKTPQTYSIKGNKKLGNINLEILNEYFIKKDKNGTSNIPTVPA